MKQKRHICSIAVYIIMFLLIFILNFFVIDRIADDTWRTFLVSLFSTISAALLVNGIWELIEKERFTKHLLELVKISSNISTSGLEAVFIDFTKIPWDSELVESKNLIAVITYADTWRTTYKKELEALSKKGRLKVIVPNYENDTIMDEFDRRFIFAKGETRQKIESCIDFFIKINADVYLYDGSIQSSYYMLDSVSYMSFFNHSQDQGIVPALKIENKGQMHKYVKNEIDNILNSSTRIKSFTRELDEKREWKVTMEK